MTPVPELFIAPEQALHRTPLLAFLEPEGEFRSYGIRRPSARRSVRPIAKMMCKLPGRRQVTKTSPRFCWAPAVVFPTAISWLPSCRRRVRILGSAVGA